MGLAGLFSPRWPGVALFDLDGTLVDSAPDLAAATNQMLEQLGRPPASLEAVRSYVGHGVATLVRRALAGNVKWQPVRERDERLFDDALAMFHVAYARLNGQHSRVFPGVESCLRTLSYHGCRLGLVTNKPERFIAPLMEQMGLAGWFQLSIGGDTLATKKPDPAPLLVAMERLRGTRGTTVMVGDSVADIEAAQAARIPCVAVRYGYHGSVRIDALGADAVVDSLDELL